MNRWTAISVSVVLFGAVYALRMALPDPGAGVLFLAFIPIAVLALELGLLGGLAGAAIATLVTFAWVAQADVDLGTIGFATRITSYVVTGVGAGLFVEQRGRHAHKMHELEETTARHAKAIQVHETIVQRLSVAKMALELEDPTRALPAVEEALRSAQAVVTEGVDLDEDFRTDSGAKSGSA